MATDNDETIEIRRITGVLRSAEERAVADLIQTITTHREEVSDPQAELAIAPLDEAAAADMMDSAGCVSGYRRVNIKDLFGQTEQGFERMIAEMLTRAELVEVEYEAVWAMGQIVVLYVRGVEKA